MRCIKTGIAEIAARKEVKESVMPCFQKDAKQCSTRMHEYHTSDFQHRLHVDKIVDTKAVNSLDEVAYNMAVFAMKFQKEQ